MHNKLSYSFTVFVMLLLAIGCSKKEESKADGSSTKPAPATSAKSDHVNVANNFLKAVISNDPVRIYDAMNVDGNSKNWCEMLNKTATTEELRNSRINKCIQEHSDAAKEKINLVVNGNSKELDPSAFIPSSFQYIKTQTNDHPDGKFYILYYRVSYDKGKGWEERGKFVKTAIVPMSVTPTQYGPYMDFQSLTSGEVIDTWD